MLAQILAVAIFLLMFVLIVWDRIERHIVVLSCGACVLLFVFGLAMGDGYAILTALNLEEIFHLPFWYTTGSEEVSAGINWATIFFLTGMMIMVEGMSRVGFFRWLCLQIAKMVKYKTIPIFITFMIMSAFLSMFIDSITVIMFLAAVTLELARLLKFNPVPMILAEIFCANLGGSASMCGDPPNIIIGTSLGFSFFDFLSNTGVIALISIVFTIAYFYLCFRKELGTSGNDPLETVSYPNPKQAISDKKGFVINTIVFLFAIVLLITHAQTGLTVATIGVLVAILSLIAAGKKAFHILKLVDYKTILFFIGLFIVVSGLEQTGILEIIAVFIQKLCGNNFMLMLGIILWISAIASAFVDNIPFAATMIPIIKTLSLTQGAGSLPILAWTLSIGADIGGSATPIGASANVVGTSIAAKEGHPISWGEYCKYLVPATVMVMLISMICIFIRYL